MRGSVKEFLMHSISYSRSAPGGDDLNRLWRSKSKSNTLGEEISRHQTSPVASNPNQTSSTTQAYSRGGTDDCNTRTTVFVSQFQEQRSIAGWHYHSPSTRATPTSAFRSALDHAQTRVDNGRGAGLVKRLEHKQQRIQHNRPQRAVGAPQVLLPARPKKSAKMPPPTCVRTNVTRNARVSKNATPNACQQKCHLEC